MNTYHNDVKSIIEEIFETQQECCIKATEAGYNSVMNNHKFYIFGTGHSHMMVEEFYDRLKGPNVYSPILMPELMLHQFPNKSTAIERTEQYADVILGMYPFEEGDTIMLVSNSGRNGCLVELALRAKEKGVTIVAVTNHNQAKNVLSRHSSGKNILDFADININNCGYYGDAFYAVDNDKKAGATSNITTLMIAQLINALMIKRINNKSESDQEIIERFMEYYLNCFNRAGMQMNIDKAANILLETFKTDNDIFVIGTGHSHLLTEEFYSRAGGFAMIRAILEDEIMNHQGKGKSNFIETLPQYATYIMDKYKLKKGDTLICCSNSGKGAMTNELASLCKQNGVSVIAITNLRQTNVSQHASGLLLKEIAELVVDNGCEAGDAMFSLEDIKCCPLSSSLGCYIVQSICVELATKMQNSGITPPILTSANVDKLSEKNEKFNEEIKTKYKNKYLVQHEL